MAIVKKGSRKIIVREIAFRWRANRYRMASGWRKDSQVLSEKYSAIAAKYGLGDVANITFHIPIELYENPVSKIMVKYFGYCVDGFLGIEQLLEIKPKTIAAIIEHFLDSGWDPTIKGDRHTELYDLPENHSPPILVIPGSMNDDVKEYPDEIHILRIA